MTHKHSYLLLTHLLLSFLPWCFWHNPLFTKFIGQHSYFFILSSLGRVPSSAATEVSIILIFSSLLIFLYVSLFLSIFSYFPLREQASPRHLLKQELPRLFWHQSLARGANLLKQTCEERSQRRRGWKEEEKKACVCFKSIGGSWESEWGLF